jgi:hypothetical protein
MKGKTLYECARWWRSQSFSHDIGGSFNIELYYEYLKCKAKCSDFNTTSTPNSYENGCSQAEDSASGKSENSSCEEIAQWDTLKSNEDDTRAID